MVKNYESPILVVKENSDATSTSCKLVKQNMLDNILAFSKAIDVQFTKEKEPILLLRN